MNEEKKNKVKSNNKSTTSSNKKSKSKSNIKEVKKESFNKSEEKKINKDSNDSKIKKEKTKENILIKTMSIPVSAIKSKLEESAKDKKVESEAVRLYKKKKEKKQRQKRKFNGRISFDVFGLLILIITVAFISCLLTCIISNYQFKKRTNLINRNVVTDKSVQDFLNTYSEILDNYYEDINKDEMMAAAMSGMLEYLEDNYSIYLNADASESLEESLDGSYSGLGIVVRGTIVEDVYKNSPASEAGIEAGDELVGVNGTEISLENYGDIGQLLDKENENDIVVKRENKELSFKVKISNVYVPATSSTIIKSPNKKKSIGYINLSTFSVLAYEDFKESLEDLEEKEIDSLIIDLRSNTGGYLDVASNISNLFLEKDQIIYSLESKNKITSCKDETDEKREYPIVVLVNEATASAAEVLASALHDSYGATIVGKKTYGKGKVQKMRQYEGSIVKYTSAKWLRPNGECIDEIGIVPEYEVDLLIENNTIYDKQLDKAIELLNK